MACRFSMYIYAVAPTLDIEVLLAIWLSISIGTLERWCVLRVMSLQLLRHVFGYTAVGRLTGIVEQLHADFIYLWNSCSIMMIFSSGRPTPWWLLVPSRSPSEQGSLRNYQRGTLPLRGGIFSSSIEGGMLITCTLTYPKYRIQHVIMRSSQP